MPSRHLKGKYYPKIKLLKVSGDSWTLTAKVLTRGHLNGVIRDHGLKMKTKWDGTTIMTADLAKR